MRDQLKEAFGQVRAEEELKAKTKAFLLQKMGRYTKQKVSLPRRIIPAAACLIVLLLGGSGAWLFWTPTATISIDINPSIELQVNRFDRIISVTGYNNDGQELAASLQIQYSGYQEAVERILSDGEITALLSDGAVMTIGVIGSESPQSKQILTDLKSCTRSQENAYCYYARPEDLEVAHELGLSTGKYRVYLELQALDPYITPEEIQQMTMREIRDRIALLSAGGREKSQADSQSESGRGYGLEKQHGWQGGA